jgi:hypothetical protein
VGVPDRTPVVVSVTPVGRAPDSVNVGAGEPVAVTVNVPAAPFVNVVLLAEVITGGALTDRGDDAEIATGRPSSVPAT